MFRKQRSLLPMVINDGLIGRQSLPEFYKRLLCVKIYQERFGPISEDGRLFNGTSFPFLEWKIDTAGMPFETFAISKIIDRLQYLSRVSSKSA